MRYDIGVKLQYCKVIEHHGGPTKVITENGETAVEPNENIVVTLNKFGKEGWEVIFGGTNIDSSGVAYLLKRERKEDGSEDSLLEYYKREGE
jgi:hypothetical protein